MSDNDKANENLEQSGFDAGKSDVTHVGSPVFSNTDKSPNMRQTIDETAPENKNYLNIEKQEQAWLESLGFLSLGDIEAIRSHKKVLKPRYPIRDWMVERLVKEFQEVKHLNHTLQIVRILSTKIDKEDGPSVKEVGLAFAIVNAPYMIKERDGTRLPDENIIKYLRRILNKINSPESPFRMTIYVNLEKSEEDSTKDKIIADSFLFRIIGKRLEQVDYKQKRAITRLVQRNENTIRESQKTREEVLQEAHEYLTVNRELSRQIQQYSEQLNHSNKTIQTLDQQNEQDRQIAIAAANKVKINQYHLKEEKERKAELAKKIKDLQDKLGGNPF